MEFYIGNFINRNNNRSEIILTKKYLLYGYGISNKSVERFFIKHHVKYEILKEDVNFDLTSIDIIIKSPGIPFDAEILLLANKLNKLVITDIELFSMLYPHANIIAVTGTNGKTTTSILIYQLLNNKKTLLAGNIGIPVFDLEPINNFEDEIIIIECSSYMLANTYTFHPKILVITNIFPNHLDHHLTFEHYVTSKLKPLQNMNANDLLICHSSLSIYDEIKNFIGKTIYIDDNNNCDLVLRQDNLYYKNTLIIKNFSSVLPGNHNFLNFKMALTVNNCYKISINQIKITLNNFVLPCYRLEKIYHDHNLTIYNDSKSTNISSLLSAIDFLKNEEKNIYWIGGGLSRLENWQEFSELFLGFNKIYLYGENRFEIRKGLSLQNLNCYCYKTLEEVIDNLPHSFSTKTCILFSPASPSTDQFSNFIERGNLFNTLIFKKYLIGKNNC